MGVGSRGRGGEEGRAGSSTNLKYVERPYFGFLSHISVIFVSDLFCFCFI